MKNLVLLGTARTDSNTLKAIKELCPFPDYEIVDLREMQIAAYSYDQCVSDDFVKIAEMMQAAEHIVFATPVYWYSMSFVMKNFIDRFSDLLRTYQPIGKSLVNKKTYLITTSSSDVPLGFQEPFRLTSEYLGMKYQGMRFKQFS